MHPPARGTTAVRATLPLVAALTAVLCGGCAATRTETCVDWVQLPTPADAVAAADLVVRTTGPAPTSGTVELFGADAAVHAVPVEEVLAGSGAGAGDVLDVAATPETCTGAGIYPDGDPLDAPGPQVLLLTRDEDTGAWRTLTPHHGVVAAPDGTVPTAWPGSAPTGGAGGDDQG